LDCTSFVDVVSVIEARSLPILKTVINVSCSFRDRKNLVPTIRHHNMCLMLFCVGLVHGLDFNDDAGEGWS